MQLKEHFSYLFNQSASKNNSLWLIEWNPKEKDCIESIEILYESVILDLFKSIPSEELNSIALKHFKELIEFKNDSKNYEEYIYLKFLWGTILISNFNTKGEFIYCHDLFMLSIFDFIPKNGEDYELNSTIPFKFLYLNYEFSSNTRFTSEIWFSSLYYYSKSFSGLNDWGELFLEEIYHFYNDGFKISFHHPQLLSSLFAWCEVNLNSKASRAFINLIIREYDNLKWSKDELTDEIKARLALQILLNKNFRNNEKRDLFNTIQKHYKLDPIAKMQSMEAICYNFEVLTDNLVELIKYIEETSVYLENQSKEQIDIFYAKGRLINTILDTIIIAGENGRSDIIEDILFAFYSINNPKEKGRVLFIFPNLLGRISYCYDNKLIEDKKNVQDVIVKIINVKNKAFNSFHLLKGGQKQVFSHNKKIIGHPNFSEGDNYENALTELYSFNIIEKDIDNIDSICQFSFSDFPIQTLMIKSIGKTLPINLSLSNKLPFQNIEKVLIWSGNSFTSEIECKTIDKIFRTFNIKCEIHNSGNSSLQKYLSCVDEFNPDILWISTHGEYVHYEPNKSEIIFSDKEKLGIRDYNSLLNNHDKRRLLFLNLCEGAIHNETGELKNVGFPNLLTTNNQDVLSHLWMADSNSSLIFGILFAISISKNKYDFFNSYQYAMLKLLTDKETINNELKSTSIDLNEIVEKIQNMENMEWSNLITSGSLAYYI